MAGKEIILKINKVNELIVVQTKLPTDKFTPTNFFNIKLIFFPMKDSNI